jgi:hypothetical protein
VVYALLTVISLATGVVSREIHGPFPSMDVCQTFVDRAVAENAFSAKIVGRCRRGVGS